MTDDYSAYLMAKQRMAALQAEARAAQLADAARQGRPPAQGVTQQRPWSRVLRGGFSLHRHQTGLADGVAP